MPSRNFHALRRWILVLALATLTGASVSASEYKLGPDDSTGRTEWVEVWWRLEVDELGRGTLHNGEHQRFKSSEALRGRLNALVSRWEFEPAKVKGIPVTGSTGLRFVLKVTAVDAERVEGLLQHVSVSPLVLRRVAPRYPFDALRQSRQGDVLVELTIAPSGRVRGVRKVESTVNRDLEDAALRAAREWVFQADEVAGRRVETKVIVPFRLRIPGREPDVEQDPKASDQLTVISADQIRLLTTIREQPL